MIRTAFVFCIFTICTFKVFICATSDRTLLNFNFDNELTDFTDRLTGFGWRNALSSVENKHSSSNFTITDATSISNLTVDLFHCQIPFVFNVKEENYFCVQNENDPTSKFQCNTTSNIISECSLGKFLLIQSPVKTDLTLKDELDFTSENEYIVTFEYFLNNENCIETDFQFEIGIDPKGGRQVGIFDSDNITIDYEKNTKWISHVTCIRTGINDIFKLKINAVIFPNCANGFIAIDNLKIVENKLGTNSYCPKIFDKVTTQKETTTIERTTESESTSQKSTQNSDTSTSERSSKSKSEFTTSEKLTAKSSSLKVDETTETDSTREKLTQNSEGSTSKRSFGSTSEKQTAISSSLKTDKDETTEKQTLFSLETSTTSQQFPTSQNSFLTSAIGLTNNKTSNIDSPSEMYKKEYELIAIIMSGCGIFLILIGTAFIFCNYRIKKQRRSKEEALNRKNLRKMQNHARRTRRVHDHFV